MSATIGGRTMQCPITPRTGRITFHFDGGCRPNPGAMEAAVVSGSSSWYRGDLGHGDNNEAEWLALLYAVELAAATRAPDVLLVGDSTLVIEQARGRWRCRSAQLRRHLDAFHTAAAGIARLTLRQVPRSKNLAGITLARRHAGEITVAETEGFEPSIRFPV